MIRPVEIVGNMSAGKNSAIGPFVSVESGDNIASIVNSETIVSSENIANIANIVNIVNSENIANIANIVSSASSANIVMDPFGNLGDRALGNLSAADPFLVQPDLPDWVGLNQ